MSGCCDSGGWDQVFGPRFARHVAARYRKRGLDRTAQRMADWLVSQGIQGATVLDIGGGVGEIGLALLRLGASSATTLELSSSYDAPAAALAVETGMADRVERRMGDIATDGSVAASADVVVLHRVVCCYPDVERLLAAAADHARRAVVLSHPPRNAFWRGMTALQNIGLRMLGREYRSFDHPPAAMVQVLRDHGFATEYVHRGPIWQVLGATRALAPTGRSGSSADSEAR
jgi:magnesium-protoporphyrin O-methyltransferase